MDQMMDPRALEAFVAATPYVAEGATEVAKTIAEGAGEGVGAIIVKEAFVKLKECLRRKGSDGGRAADAAEELIVDPDSEGRKLVLAEKLEAAGADEDPEVRVAARELLEAVKAQPGGEQHVANTMTAIGKYIAQAAPGGTASVWANRPEAGEK